jgi:hypothetical protein
MKYSPHERNALLCCFMAAATALTVFYLLCFATELHHWIAIPLLIAFNATLVIAILRSDRK